MKLSNEQVQDFLRRVNTKIIEKGMTKTEFYDKSGITSALFSQWNKGKQQPSEKSVAKAAQALGATVDELLPLSIDEQQKKPPLVAGEKRQELILRLLNGEISEDTAELLLQIADKTK